MAKARKGVDGSVKAFRSEVDMLRNVIKRTVSEVIGEKLEEVEALKKRQRLIEGSLKKAETKTSLFQDLKPLIRRVEALERGLRSMEKTAGSFGSEVERGVREFVKGKRIEGVLEDIVESKTAGLNRRILMLGSELEMMRGELESSKAKRLEEELQKSVGNLNSKMNKVIVDVKGLEERFGAEIDGLKKETAGPGRGEPAKGLNMEGLRRDLEIIKTKQEWIENNIERIDIKPLMRKIEELEHRIRVINVSSPIVLE